MKSYSKPILYTEEIVDINEPVAMGDSWLSSDCCDGSCTAILNQDGSGNVVWLDSNTARITVQVDLGHDSENLGNKNKHHAYAQYLIFHLPNVGTWTHFGRTVEGTINNTPLTLNGNLGRVLAHYHFNTHEDSGTGALFLTVTDVAGYTDQELIAMCSMDVDVFDDYWQVPTHDDCPTNHW